MEAAKKIDMFPIVNDNKSEKSLSYVPLKRSFFNHFLWKEKRTFSKCEAWLDMIQQARFEQSEAKQLIGGKLIKWKRGQLVASIRFLGNRWNWGKHKVDDFIKMLQEETMISVATNQGQTIITLLNYEMHNGERQNRGHGRGQLNQPPASISAGLGDSEGDRRGTDGGQTGDKTNNVNKENNSMGAAAPPKPKSFKQWTEQEFYTEVATFKNAYTKEMLRAFFNHWSEKSASGKMAFQLKTTWETNKRLETWKRNETKFGTKELVPKVDTNDYLAQRQIDQERLNAKIS
jgi:hypothetical protein